MFVMDNLLRYRLCSKPHDKRNLVIRLALQVRTYMSVSMNRCE